MLLLISYEEDVINSTNSLDGNGNQLVGTCSVESRGRRDSGHAPVTDLVQRDWSV